jgi:ABC-2 type transport system ATP-binding protein
MVIVTDAFAIEAKGLRKTYGTHHPVDSLDLTVERGEVFALLGPNGAGKTTTVEMPRCADRSDASP